MENIRKTISFIDSIFNVFMGTELVQPTEETRKSYPDIYYS
ncbi:hypothetical protein ACFLWR_04920 [Chloroflexota bacterium]